MAKKKPPEQKGPKKVENPNVMGLRAQVLGRGFAWMDAGTVDSLMEAASFVETVQNRQGLIISAPEEVAYHARWISREALLEAAEQYGRSSYGEHLRRVAEDRLLYDGGN